VRGFRFTPFPGVRRARKIETILWAYLEVSLMNQKVETNISFAYTGRYYSEQTVPKK
jgi:hypothetical protein